MKETPEQKPRFGDCGKMLFRTVSCVSPCSTGHNHLLEALREQTTVESLKLMAMVIIKTVGAS